MWKRLPNSLVYYILFTHEENFNISVSDFVKIWTVQFSVDQFTTCLKESNHILKIDTNEMITNGIEMLSYPESLKSADISLDGENLRISCSKSFCYPLKIKMILKLGSHELFFQKVTQPLLKTVYDLHNSENELCHLLQSKDKEIEEYKAKAGEVCLRYLKTKTFNDVAHMEKHMLYDIHFGSMSIPESLLEKSVVIPEEGIIKKELDIKMKETTEDTNIEVKTETVKVTQEDVKIESQAPISIVKKRKIRLNL